MGVIKGQVVSPAATDLMDDSGVAGASSLTSLAAGGAAISAAQDNTPASGDAALSGTFQLAFQLSTVSGIAANPTIDLNLLYSFDGGATYDDGTAGASPVTVSAHYVGSFPVRSTTAMQYVSLRGVPLEYLKYKAQLINNAGVALAAQSSGQKLSLVKNDLQY
ncbi:MAG TPA: hypothetical protein VFW87_09495 [Pirellulales bacterium]|nr:hypothetical protein [Pirellulales bacterium]